MFPVKESREDSASVHSLELPQTKITDPSDSQSVSSTDLTSADTPTASAESKSLDSLDLKSDVVMDKEGKSSC